MGSLAVNGMLFEPVHLDLRTVPADIVRDVKQQLEQESFRDRIVDMFRRTNESKQKYESTMLQVMSVSAFGIGHFLEMRRSMKEEFENFKRTNQLTVYKNQLDASRKAFDVTVMRSMFRATRSGFRLSLYVTSVVFGTFAIQAARNQSSWFDLALSYAVVSTVAKAHRGPVAMLVAGSVGGLLGMVVSAPFCQYQRFMQATYPERRLRVAAYELMSYRNIAAREQEEKSIIAIDEKFYIADTKKSNRLDLTGLREALDSIVSAFRDALGLSKPSDDAPDDESRTAK